MKTISNIRPSWVQMVPLALFTLVGLGVSIFLAWQGFSDSGIVGCGENQLFDCGHVLTSRWSKIFSLPVSSLAVAAYSLIFCSFCVYLLARNEAIKKACGIAMYHLVLTVGFAGLWFVALQVVLQRFCIYCLVVHSCSISMACVLVLACKWRGHRIKLAMSSLSLVALMGVVQVLTPEAPTFRIEEFKTNDFNQLIAEPELFSPLDDSTVFDPDPSTPSPSKTTSIEASTENACQRPYAAGQSNLSTIPQLLLLARPSLLVSGIVSSSQDLAQSSKKTQSDGNQGRTVSFLNGAATIRSGQWPILGRPTAKHIVIELFDYTCIHCRKTAKIIDEACEKYGDDFAVIALPVPMNTRCNDAVRSDHAVHAEACELSRIAIAVWLTSPEKFSEFHQWMMKEGSAPRASAALSKAAELVDATRLDQTLGSKRTEKYLDTIVRIYKRTGGGTIPKIIFAKTAIVGQPQSVETLTEMIERSLK